jgi:hypothetical protein
MVDVDYFRREIEGKIEMGLSYREAVEVVIYDYETRCFERLVVARPEERMLIERIVRWVGWTKFRLLDEL